MTKPTFLHSAALVGAGIGGCVMGTSRLDPLAAAGGGQGGSAVVVARIAFAWPNMELKAALEDIDRIQEGMGLTSAAGSADLLREARAGGMYAHDPCE